MGKSLLWQTCLWQIMGSSVLVSRLWQKNRKDVHVLLLYVEKPSDQKNTGLKHSLNPVLPIYHKILVIDS